MGCRIGRKRRHIPPVIRNTLPDWSGISDAGLNLMLDIMSRGSVQVSCKVISSKVCSTCCGCVAELLAGLRCRTISIAACHLYSPSLAPPYLCGWPYVRCAEDNRHDVRSVPDLYARDVASTSSGAVATAVAASEAPHRATTP